MVLSKPFNTKHRQAYGLSFFLTIGITAAFKSSGKQPFLKDKLTIFIRMEPCKSFLDFNIPAGIYLTGMAFVPSDFEISFRTASSVTSLMKDLSGFSLSSYLWCQWNLSNIPSWVVGVSEQVSLSFFESQIPT